MAESLWMGEFTINPLEKKIDYTSTGVIDRKELMELAKADSTWANLEKYLMGREPFTVKGRLGGGILPFTNEFYIVVQRDMGAPRMPGCLDTCAGVPDAIPEEVSSSPKQPIIPITPRLISEMYEVMPAVLRGDNLVEFNVIVPNLEGFLPSDLVPSIESYMETTGRNTASLVAHMKNLDVYLTKVMRKKGSFGKFKDGWTIKEAYGNSGIKIDGILVAYEKGEGSIEVTFPLYIPLETLEKEEPLLVIDVQTREVKLVGGKVVYYDGEHFGPPPYVHDIGFVGLPNLTLLDRYVLLLYLDGEVKVFKGGKVVYTGDFAGYAEKKDEKGVSLRQLIKEGKTPGMTSKVEKLYEEATRWNETITPDGKSRSLRPFKEIGDYIKGLRETK